MRKSNAFKPISVTLAMVMGTVFSCGVIFSLTAQAAPGKNPTKHVKKEKKIEIRKKEEERIATEDYDKFRRQNIRLAQYYKEMAKRVQKQGGDPTPLLKAAEHFQAKNKLKPAAKPIRPTPNNPER